MTTRRTRTWMLVLVLAGVIVPLCIAYVDRPVADFVHQKVAAGTIVFTWAGRFLSSLRWATVLLLAMSVVAGARMLAGKPTGRFLTTVFACSVSMIAAVVIAVLLKRLIGRSDAYPTYIVNGIYGFRPLHGGPGFQGFPSATTAGASAVMAALWHRAPRWRSLAAVTLAVVVMTIILTNGHWVADVVGGGLLGVFVGFMLRSLTRS